MAPPSKSKQTVADGLSQVGQMLSEMMYTHSDDTDPETIQVLQKLHEAIMHVSRWVQAKAQQVAQDRATQAANMTMSAGPGQSGFGTMGGPPQGGLPAGMPPDSGGMSAPMQNAPMGAGPPNPDEYARMLGRSTVQGVAS